MKKTRIEENQQKLWNTNYFCDFGDFVILCIRLECFKKFIYQKVIFIHNTVKPTIKYLSDLSNYVRP